VDLAIAALIVAGAALLRGATGFGFAIVAAPAFAFIWPTDLSTSVVLLLDVVATVMIIKSGALAHLHLRDAWLICGSALFGVVIGTLVIKNLPPDVARLGLDICVLVSAVAALLKLRSRALAHWSVAILVGTLVGAMIGAFAVGGTLLVAWLMTTDRTPKEMRALLTLAFGIADTFSIVLRVALGIFPLQALINAALLTPVMVAAILIGSLAFHRLPADLWRRGVAIMLIFIAGMSLTHTLFFD
jgi:uncharacterized membrane protein YfcA